MWRVYRRTRKDEDYANYKEALNLATNEITKYKRTFEKKLAGNIKNDSKSFYAYVRSNQKVRDKVGPLENNSDLTRFNKICHPSQRPRWQVDKEAIGLSRVQQCSPTYNPPS